MSAAPAAATRTSRAPTDRTSVVPGASTSRRRRPGPRASRGSLPVSPDSIGPFGHDERYGAAITRCKGVVHEFPRGGRLPIPELRATVDDLWTAAVDRRIPSSTSAAAGVAATTCGVAAVTARQPHGVPSHPRVPGKPDTAGVPSSCSGGDGR